ncbi:MAG: PQQ-dependent sugar dehydrogenase, partial [Gemmataceae bacterium]
MRGLCCGLLVLLMGAVSAQVPKAQEPKKNPPKKETPKKPAPPKKPSPATPVNAFKVKPGYRVELLYTVPKDQEGSWVSMCTDPKGRLILCDQYGGLFRVTPPPINSTDETKVEKMPIDIGDAQGLLWAFDSLYVMVNSGQRQNGLYRVTDTNNDDMPDKVELLRALQGGGEHGPHAILPHPDGKRLTVIHGNQTKLTKVDVTRPKPIWGEDHLLPRMPDGRGFMAGVNGPGGAVYHVTPDGKNWELVSVGYRNQYDIAYHFDGEVFTFDADMEWDFNTPWYRPTRVNVATSGSEYGWRNGAGKYPAYYAESLPAVVDIGPGSPTGVVFGYGAKFPAKDQNALFICDWSYGKLYAVHLQAQGSSYSATFEEFLSASPLPLTDLVVNPLDGALYFAIGGR